MNILVVSYQISPYRGTEYSVGWNHVMQISKDNNVYVIYSSRPFGIYNDDIKEFCKQNHLNNVTFIDCHENSIVFNLLSIIENHVPGFFWQFFASILCRKDIKSISKKINSLQNIDIIHFLNSVGFRTLSFKYRIASHIPCIWGPVQSAEPGEWFLVKNLLLKHKKVSFFINYLLRITYHKLLFSYSSDVHAMLKICNRIFAATPHSEKMFLKHYGIEADYLPENCVNAIERQVPIQLKKQETLKIMFCGGIDSRKNIYILLEALKKIKEYNFVLMVAGRISEADFNKLIENHGLQGKAKWLGMQKRDDLQKFISESHILAIPSIREVSTTVLWEAMAKLVPILTLDICGMSGVLTNKDSIKIDVSSHNYGIVVQKMADEIKNVIENPERINELSHGMLLAANKYSKENRQIFWDKIYREVVC